MALIVFTVAWYFIRPANADVMKIETGIGSGYEIMDKHVPISDEVVAQGSFFYVWDRGFYAGVWGSNNIDSFDSNFGNNSGAELDFIVGWAGDVSHGVTLNVSAAEWLYPGSSNDFSVLNGKASRKFSLETNHTIEPYVGLEGQWTDNDSVAIGHIGLIDRFTFREITLVNEGRFNFFDEGTKTFVYLASVEIPLRKGVALVPFYRSSYYFGSGDCIKVHCGPTICDHSDWDSEGGLKVSMTF